MISRIPLARAFIACAAMLCASVSHAQTYSIVHAFKKYSSPDSDLSQDSSGKFYGTLFSGGAHHGGSVFELSEKNGVWSEKDIYSFSGDDGWQPVGGVLIVGNTLWGTTANGGTAGYGNVFSLTRNGKTWSETAVHSFVNSDGYQPISDLFRDPDTGDILGTTSAGGSNACGTVFAIDPDGVFSTIYNFARDSSDGCYPSTALRAGPSKGTLVGMTQQGGTFGQGATYMLSRNGQAWSESVLYSFTGQNDGQFPTDVRTDASGHIFGTTISGSEGPSSYGTVFELISQGGTWQESTLFAFGSQPYAGAAPVGLYLDQNSGSIYGATLEGGVGGGGGTVFSLVPDGDAWTFTSLHSFDLRALPIGGYRPMASPIIDARSGRIFGTTQLGGQFGGGIVYSLVP